MGRHKTSELIIGLEPHVRLGRFKHALQFSFKPVSTYQWQNENGQFGKRIEEKEIGDGWKKSRPIPIGMKASFSLPCALGVFQEQDQEGRPFIIFAGNRKRRRKTLGWLPHYVRKDPDF